MSGIRRTIANLASVGMFCGVAGAADVLRVDDDAAPGGDGSSWTRAFDSLTDALAAASSGDQVWVAKGEYVPTTPAGRNATFTIPDGVQVFGGFAGGENTLPQRGDPLDPPVILSGKLNATDNAYHVVSMTAAGSTTVLDGFYIRLGIADGPGASTASVRRGGGITTTDSQPTLRNLVVQDCSAAARGAGAFFGGSASPGIRVEDCLFEDNSTTAIGSRGGAVYAETSTQILRTDFRDNTALIEGGALWLTGSGLHVIDECEFTRNTAGAGMGGAIGVSMTLASSSSIVTRSTFRDNVAGESGAIGYRMRGDHTVRASRFLSNDSTSQGGGAIYHNMDNAGDSLLVENCLVSGNTAALGSGGIGLNSPGSISVVNSTIARNTSSGFSGGLHCGPGVLRVDNSIVWDNNSTASVGQDDSLWSNALATLTVNRSIIEHLGINDPVPAGVGAIDDDPMFVDLDGGDNTPGTNDDNPRLMPGSPAIDRGASLLLTPDGSVSDLYAAPRLRDDTGTPDTGDAGGLPAVVDLGAAEFQGTTVGGACNAADLAEPFSTLNFSDVLAFLTAFGSMSPDADLAAPADVFDFSDVLAFLGAFGAGCP